MSTESEIGYSYLNLTEEIYTRAFTQAVADQVFVVDKNGQFLDVKMNRNDPDNFLPPESYNGKTIYDIDLDPKLADRFKACILTTIVKKELQVLRYTLPLKNKLKYNEARFFYLDMNRVLVINRNITPLVEITTKLFNNQTILRSIIDNHEETIFALDLQKRYMMFNNIHKKAMKFKYGVDIEMGKKITDFVDIEEDLGLGLSVFAKVVEGQTITFESEFGNKSMFRGMTQIHVYPLKDNEGKIFGVTVFARDRSFFHKAQQQRDKYVNTLEKLLSDLSHKLRKPVASMLGLIQLVDEVKDMQEMNNLLTFFRESVSEMDEYIRQMSASLEENKNAYD